MVGVGEDLSTPFEMLPDLAIQMSYIRYQSLRLKTTNKVNFF